MRRVTALLSTMAFVVFAAGLSAQAKPSFAGKWVPDAEKNTAAMGGRTGGRGPSDMTITQDTKTLTISRTTQAGDTKTVYNLDGTDSKNMAGRAGSQTEQVSKAVWTGDKLVITTTTANGDRVQSWYLEGGELVSETTGANGPQKTYYKKAM
jgi:hypothetical protein